VFLSKSWLRANHQPAQLRGGRVKGILLAI